MRPELYERFLFLKERGNKGESKAYLDNFIASFSSLGEKRAWVHHFFETRYTGGKVRHEIYENLVFPVLLDGYLHNEAWSLLWLFQTKDNLYANKALHAQVGFRAGSDFLRQAYAMEPAHSVRRFLLAEQIRGFDYCQHEWPSGILYGADGATQSECEELLREIAFTRQLDIGRLHTGYLNDFLHKVEEYQARLSTHNVN